MSSNVSPPRGRRDYREVGIGGREARSVEGRVVLVPDGEVLEVALALGEELCRGEAGDEHDQVADDGGVVEIEGGGQMGKLVGKALVLTEEGPRGEEEREDDARAHGAGD